ncbi:hypothetical protein BLNAU_2901 [Blattamonas nauphoetae]|uniref:Uncharacterized protein n=1 Tax=Blattamonas nauphoetae TaxID=2049346 RepID=A0ABQ9YF35_9EUKA|nr:hypothetical protein BLNAU_2901 [Blattamonas nauphoetae]
MRKHLVDDFIHETEYTDGNVDEGLFVSILLPYVQSTPSELQSFFRTLDPLDNKKVPWKEVLDFIIQFTLSLDTNEVLDYCLIPLPEKIPIEHKDKIEILEVRDNVLKIYKASDYSLKVTLLPPDKSMLEIDPDEMEEPVPEPRRSRLPSVETSYANTAPGSTHQSRNTTTRDVAATTGLISVPESPSTLSLVKTPTGLVSPRLSRPTPRTNPNKIHSPRDAGIATHPFQPHPPDVMTTPLRNSTSNVERLDRSPQTLSSPHGSSTFQQRSLITRLGRDIPIGSNKETQHLVSQPFDTPPLSDRPIPTLSPTFKKHHTFHGSPQVSLRHISRSQSFNRPPPTVRHSFADPFVDTDSVELSSHSTDRGHDTDDSDHVEDSLAHLPRLRKLMISPLLSPTRNRSNVNFRSVSSSPRRRRRKKIKSTLNPRFTNTNKRKRFSSPDMKRPSDPDMTHRSSDPDVSILPRLGNDSIALTPDQQKPDFFRPPFHSSLTARTRRLLTKVEQDRIDEANGRERKRTTHDKLLQSMTKEPTTERVWPLDSMKIRQLDDKTYLTPEELEIERARIYLAHVKMREKQRGEVLLQPDVPRPQRMKKGTMNDDKLKELKYYTDREGGIFSLHPTSKPGRPLPPSHDSQHRSIRPPSRNINVKKTPIAPQQQFLKKGLWVSALLPLMDLNCFLVATSQFALIVYSLTDLREQGRYVTNNQITSLSLTPHSAYHTFKDVIEYRIREAQGEIGMEKLEERRSEWVDPRSPQYISPFQVNERENLDRILSTNVLDFVSEHDSKLILAGDVEGTVHLLQPLSPKGPRQFISKAKLHNDRVNQIVCVSSDIFASCSSDGSIVFVDMRYTKWGIHRKIQLQSKPSPLSSHINRGENLPSPSQKMVSVAVATPQEKAVEKRINQIGFVWMLMHKSRNQIIAVTTESTISVYNHLNGTLLASLEGHSSPILRCFVDEKRDLLFSVAENMEIIVWEMNGFKKIQQITDSASRFEAHSLFSSAAFSSRRSIVYAASERVRGYFLDTTADFDERRKVVEHHSPQPSHLSVSPQLSQDSVRQQVSLHFRLHPILFTLYSHTFGEVITVSSTYVVNVVALRTNVLFFSFTLPFQPSTIFSVRLDHFQRSLVVIDHRGNLTYWNFHSGEQQLELLVPKSVKPDSLNQMGSQHHQSVNAHSLSKTRRSNPECIAAVIPPIWYSTLVFSSYYQGLLYNTTFNRSKVSSSSKEVFSFRDIEPNWISLTGHKGQDIISVAACTPFSGSCSCLFSNKDDSKMKIVVQDMLASLDGTGTLLLWNLPLTNRQAHIVNIIQALVNNDSFVALVLRHVFPSQTTPMTARTPQKSIRDFFPETLPTITPASLKPFVFHNMFFVSAMNTLCITESHSSPEIKQSEKQQSIAALSQTLNQTLATLPSVHSTKAPEKLPTHQHFIHLFSTQSLSFVGHFPIEAAPTMFATDSRGTRLLVIYATQELAFDPQLHGLTMDLIDITMWPNTMQIIKRWNSYIAEDGQKRSTSRSSSAHGFFITTPVSPRARRGLNLSSFTFEDATSNRPSYFSPILDEAVDELFAFADTITSVTTIVDDKGDIFIVSDHAGYVYFFSAENGEFLSALGQKSEWPYRLQSLSFPPASKIKAEWDRRYTQFCDACPVLSHSE